ncbi:hypothetical protein Q5H92_01935 [Hymenobacter sp. M29]|uniref:Transmembrane protein n=1 Tax=Hymenobacter mellowenesis TaxID=3063995 RepID=A0ABT9A5H8_9BACT|nr:hypothetical protein [Hymenobacter sp. M29]MDO7845099.1 hypothetical protein [Hymenobacter sp. M29]
MLPTCRQKALLLLVTGLQAGCRAERVAFSVQPVPGPHAVCQPVSQSAPSTLPLVFPKAENSKRRRGDGRKLPAANAVLPRLEKPAKSFFLPPRHSVGYSTKILSKIRVRAVSTVRSQVAPANDYDHGWETFGICFLGICLGLIVLLVGWFIASVPVVLVGLGIGLLSLLYFLIESGHL